jgi:hypothetical protein
VRLDAVEAYRCAAADALPVDFADRIRDPHDADWRQEDASDVAALFSAQPGAATASAAPASAAAGTASALPLRCALVGASPPLLVVGPRGCEAVQVLRIDLASCTVEHSFLRIPFIRHEQAASLSDVHTQLRQAVSGGSAAASPLGSVWMCVREQTQQTFSQMDL